jgi:hypothetical protein
MSETRADLEPHERELEAAFFAGDAAAERARLHDAERAARDAISEATGIRDRQLLAELAGLGIRVETLSALTLIPLIEVAWADGEMAPAERIAVLEGAASVGIEPGSVSYRLLEIWIAEEQAPDLIRVWHDFTRALCAQLDPEEVRRLEEKVLLRARAVAAAAGDAAKRSPHVSEVESAALSRLSEAFRA